MSQYGPAYIIRCRNCNQIGHSSCAYRFTYKGFIVEAEPDRKFVWSARHPADWRVRYGSMTKAGLLRMIDRMIDMAQNNLMPDIVA